MKFVMILINSSKSRFKQIKEEEKKKTNQALQPEEMQVLATVSDSDDTPDEKSKVRFCPRSLGLFVIIFTSFNTFFNVY